MAEGKIELIKEDFAQSVNAGLNLTETPVGN